MADVISDAPGTSATHVAERVFCFSLLIHAGSAIKVVGATYVTFQDGANCATHRAVTCRPRNMPQIFRVVHHKLVTELPIEVDLAAAERSAELHFKGQQKEPIDLVHYDDLQTMSAGIPLKNGCSVIDDRSYWKSEQLEAMLIPERPPLPCRNNKLSRLTSFMNVKNYLRRGSVGTFTCT